MEEKHACIYCGDTETSESDIIPDTLTNARYKSFMPSVTPIISRNPSLLTPMATRIETF